MSTVEAVYIEHSQEKKKCSMYAGVQCIQVLSSTHTHYKDNTTDVIWQHNIICN